MPNVERRSLARAAVLGAILSSMVPGGSLRAEDDPAGTSDAASSEAEELFREGFAALEGGDFILACRKLAESLALSRKIGTLLNLARCEEARGRRVEALQLFREGLERLDPADERRGIVEERLDILEASVPALRLELAPGAPESTVVSTAGQQWIVGASGVVVRLNAGSYVIDITAAGHQARSESLTLRESEELTLAIRPGPPLEGQIAPTAPAMRDAPPPSDAPGGQTTGGHAPAFVLLGVGAAGLITAGVTGAMILSAQSTVDEDCDGRICQTQAGVDAASRGDSLLIVNAVAWGVGLLGVGAGTAFLLWGGDEPSSATVSSGVMSWRDGPELIVRGRF